MVTSMDILAISVYKFLGFKFWVSFYIKSKHGKLSNHLRIRKYSSECFERGMEYRVLLFKYNPYVAKAQEQLTVSLSLDKVWCPSLQAFCCWAWLAWISKGTICLEFHSLAVMPIFLFTTFILIYSFVGFLVISSQTLMV